MTTVVPAPRTTDDPPPRRELDPLAGEGGNASELAHENRRDGAPERNRLAATAQAR